MKFAVSVIVTAAPGITPLKRNDKLPSAEQLRVQKVHEAREDEYNQRPMIEVEGMIEAVDLFSALAYLSIGLLGVADPEGFLDMELEAV